MESMTVFDMELFTLPDLMDTIQLCADEDDAIVFIEAYAEKCGDEQVTTHNLRYIFQLLRGQDAEEAERLAELFMVELPLPSERIEPLPLFGKINGHVVHPRPVTTLTYDGCLCCRDFTHKPKSRQVTPGFSFDQSRPKRAAISKPKTENRKPLKRKMLSAEEGGSMLPS